MLHLCGRCYTGMFARDPYLTYCARSGAECRQGCHAVFTFLLPKECRKEAQPEASDAGVARAIMSNDSECPISQ